MEYNCKPTIPFGFWEEKTYLGKTTVPIMAMVLALIKVLREVSMSVIISCEVVLNFIVFCQSKVMKAGNSEADNYL
jgi:hypothetical protein